MATARYLNERTTGKKTKSQSKSIVKTMLSGSILAALLVPFVLMISAVFMTDTNNNGNLQGTNFLQAQEAEGFDIARRIMCNPIAPLTWHPIFGADINGEPATHWAWQAANTDMIPYYLYSKSALVGNADDVDRGLNQILNVSTQGPSFGSVNNWIYDGEVATPEEEEEFDGDGAEYVSPYDRFGVAGLNWSSYGGEWKYYQVNACAEEPEPEDNELGVFYDDRLAPQATYNDRHGSMDVRSQQHTLGPFVRFGYAFSNVISNAIFSVAKFVITVVIAVSALAFADIANLLGIYDLLIGDDGQGGVFHDLYYGIFMPLIVVVFVITGMWILWHGIAKRQYRQSLVQGVLKPIVCFFFAIIVFAQPQVFVSLPNNAAVLGQAMILEAVNTGTIGGDGMCATQIGAFGDNEIIPDGGVSGFDAEDNIGFVERASTNASSAIGCAFWQVFLLRPWSEGQFGEPWQYLYAEGHVPDDANPDNSGTLGNDNEDMVGTAMVPLGPDIEEHAIHNWAIFQVSTQTNMHYGIDTEAINPELYTSGVHDDWWRIVDAVADYREEPMTTEEITGTSSFEIGGESFEVEDGEEVYVPVQDGTTEYWDQWVGNSGGSIGLALQSILIAIIGTFGVFVFAALAAMYAIGLTIIMAFAPVMFLFGCWAGKGQDIFKGWLELLINTTLKRIAVGLLFVFMLILTSAGMDVLDDIGWFQGVMIIALGSYLLVKNRNKLFDLFANIRLGSSIAFDRVGQAAGAKMGGMAKGTSNVVGGAAVGGAAGIKANGGLLKMNSDGKDRSGLKAFKRIGDVRLNTQALKGAGSGMWLGTKNTARNKLWGTDNAFLKEGWTAARHANPDLNRGFGQSEEVDRCAGCNQPLSGYAKDAKSYDASIDKIANVNGAYYHEMCIPDDAYNKGEYSLEDNRFMDNQEHKLEKKAHEDADKALYQAHIGDSDFAGYAQDWESASEEERAEVLGRATSAERRDATREAKKKLGIANEATAGATREKTNGYGNGRAQRVLNSMQQDEDQKRLNLEEKMKEWQKQGYIDKDGNYTAKAEANEEKLKGIEDQKQRMEKAIEYAQNGSGALVDLIYQGTDGTRQDVSKYAKEVREQLNNGLSLQNAVREVDIPYIPEEIRGHMDMEYFIGVLQVGDYGEGVRHIQEAWFGYVEENYGYTANDLKRKHPDFEDTLNDYDDELTQMSEQNAAMGANMDDLEIIMENEYQKQEEERVHQRREEAQREFGQQGF